MSDIINDAVFGNMKYKHGYIKNESVNLLGKDRDLKIVALAYAGEKICDKQRESYKKFFSKIDKISKRLPGMISEYAEIHLNEIREHFDNLRDVDEAFNYVQPRSIVFTRDGKAIIMCDVEWDEENGIGIEVVPEYKVDIQDAFL